MQVAFPCDLPAQAPQPRLAARLDQQPQPVFDRRALGARASGLECLTHQVIVDIDVRAHDVYDITIYVYVSPLTGRIPSLAD